MSAWSDSEDEDNVDGEYSGSRRLVGDTKSYRLFCVDVRRGMLRKDSGGVSNLEYSLHIIQEQMRFSIISGSSERIGVLLLGSSEIKNPAGDKGLYLLVECAVPNVDGIKAVRALMAQVKVDADSVGAPIGDPGVGCLEGALPLVPCLQYALQWFGAQVKAGHDHPHIVFLTNDDQPVNSSLSVHRPELTRFNDVFSAGVEVRVMPLEGGKPFDRGKFWDGVSSKASSLAGAGTAPLQRGGGVMSPICSTNAPPTSALYRKFVKPRALARMPFTLAPGVHLGVEIFRNLAEAKKPSAIKMDGDSSLFVTSGTRLVSVAMPAAQEKDRSGSERNLASNKSSDTSSSTSSHFVSPSITLSKSSNEISLRGLDGKVIEFGRYTGRTFAACYEDKNYVTSLLSSESIAPVATELVGYLSARLEEDKMSGVLASPETHNSTSDNGYTLGVELNRKDLMRFWTDPATGDKVFFSSAEWAALKSFSGKEGKGLRLVGFQSRSLLEDTDNCRDPLLIYPSDSDISGSESAFGSMWKAMLEKNSVAVVRYVRAEGAEPVFMALIPEQELLSDSGEQVAPPCFYAITLPFQNELRSVPPDVVEKGSASALSSTPSLMNAALDVVDSFMGPGINLADPSTLIPNPFLQNFYGTLEGIALNLPGSETGQKSDLSMPLPVTTTSQIESLLCFRSALSAAGTVSGNRKLGAGTKRKNSSENQGVKQSKSARISELSEEEWKCAAVEGKLSDFTVDVLKGGLAFFGLKISGVKKDLVERLGAYLV